MNQVRCKSCWWCKISIFAGYGRCYNKPSDGRPYVMTRYKSYCEDHVNRKKENKRVGMTLDEWIDKNIKN